MLMNLLSHSQTYPVINPGRFEGKEAVVDLLSHSESCPHLVPAPWVEGEDFRCWAER